MSSEQEQSFPILPLEFSGVKLLNVNQDQWDELELNYGLEQLTDRAYEFVQSLS
jgi:hypothetical protein